VLRAAELDMTLFYRRLADFPTTRVDASDAELLAPFAEVTYLPDGVGLDARHELAEWLRKYQRRIRADGTSDAERKASMNRKNPKFLLRNYLAQMAIDQAEAGDVSLISELLDVLRHPYDEQPGRESFAAKRPEWAKNRAGCSMLSCSS
jgi:uncharacterized protein YdiU (UPF0061 family)